MNEIQIVKNNSIIKKENNVNRIVKLDVIRTFAILCVILCHSCEAVYGMIDKQADYVIISLLHTISRLGVPLFLFLSGALLLNKKMNFDQDVKSFYKKIYCH